MNIEEILDMDNIDYIIKSEDLLNTTEYKPYQNVFCVENLTFYKTDENGEPQKFGSGKALELTEDGNLHLGRDFDNVTRLGVQGNFAFVNNDNADYEMTFAKGCIQALISKHTYGGFQHIITNSNASGAGCGVRYIHKDPDTGTETIVVQQLSGSAAYPYSEGYTVDLLANDKSVTFSLRSNTSGLIKFKNNPTKTHPSTMMINVFEGRLILGDGNIGSFSVTKDGFFKKSATSWEPVVYIEKSEFDSIIADLNTKINDKISES